MFVEFIDARRAELNRRIAEESAFLASYTSGSVDDMRVRQGRIAGLTEALELLNAAYRNANGIAP